MGALVFVEGAAEGVVGMVDVEVDVLGAAVPLLLATHFVEGVLQLFVVASAALVRVSLTADVVGRVADILVHLFRAALFFVLGATLSVVCVGSVFVDFGVTFLATFFSLVFGFGTAFGVFGAVAVGYV